MNLWIELFVELDHTSFGRKWVTKMFNSDYIYYKPWNKPRSGLRKDHSEWPLTCHYNKRNKKKVIIGLDKVRSWIGALIGQMR